MVYKCRAKMLFGEAVSCITEGAASGTGASQESGSQRVCVCVA